MSPAACIPREHPLRDTLASELHARPSMPLEAPQRVSYLAMIHDGTSAQGELAHLRELLPDIDAPHAGGGHEHLSVDAGDFRLKWERHTEFTSYTFFRDPGPDDDPARGAMSALPADWIASLPGRAIVAAHVELREADATERRRGAPRMITGDVAATISGGVALVSTDFRQVGGWTRFELVDLGLTPAQRGRTIQRLLEIETYRMMALLAFPVAREVGRLLGDAEAELADLMDRMVQASTPEVEREVLGRLTRLAAQVERSVARTTFRFGAANAYYGLVRQRIDELREVREAGYSTIGGFMDRRLAPAMNTCATIARRQADLSDRIARNSQLLRTRVDVELERQNQELLAQMNRRARLQLRLQQTVESISVVAITYYASQLVHYVAKGVKPWLGALTPEAITAVSIPVIAVFVALGLRRMHHRMASAERAP
ncbi:MAG: DUF3422 domain-containing protein [Burkholderiaceae bacterium]